MPRDKIILEIYSEVLFAEENDRRCKVSDLQWPHEKVTVECVMCDEEELVTLETESKLCNMRLTL